MSRNRDIRINQYQIDKVINFINNFNDTEFQSLEHLITTLSTNGIPLKNIEKNNDYFTFFNYENRYVVAFKSNFNHRLEIRRVEVID